jgi:phage terminase large subunit-like protein
MQPWDLSCPDWEARLRAGRLPIRDLPLTAHGDRAVAVYDRLRLADVTGTPTLADASGDWFREIVRAMFGSYDPATKQRYIRELFALVPKKNSKTTYGALGLMLTALLLNERPRAPFIMTGPVQDTAELAFSAVAGAIALDPVLDAKLHVRDHLKTIVHRETKATLEIMTFDPSVITGAKVVGALIDEEHVLGKMNRADKAMLQLRGGMQPFPEAFLAVITTQSDDAPAGVFADDLIRAREIRDGKRQGAVLPVLYEFPKEMQAAPDKPWRDPANWHMVTPNLGRSIQLQRLIDDFKDEEAKGDKALRTWASQHLNVEIGLALQSNGWAGAEFWQQQADASITLDTLIARSDVVTVGIDGGGNDDLYGFTALGREAGTGHLLSWSSAWALPIVLERRKDIASRLRDFQARGELHIVSKIEDACDAVVALIQRIDTAGKLGTLDEGKKKAIGVDAACIKQTLDALNAADYADDQIVAVPQNWRLGSAIKSTELYLSSGALSHADQTLLDWCVGNAKVEPKGNAVLITKQASGSAKIDPLMSHFNAVDLMSRNPAATGRIEDFLASPIMA